MRACVVVVVLLAACKGKGKAEEAVTLVAPTVAVATVLANNDKPPILMFLDDSGMIRLGAASSWAAVDAKQVTIAKKLSRVAPADGYVREVVALGTDPLAAVKRWDELPDSQVDLSTVEDPATRPVSQDDPPPPPEEELDDGAEESGGTGTMINLEEGKMGKADSDRATGAYPMKMDDVDPELARQQAIEQARASGVLGPGASGDDDLPYRASTKPAPNVDGLPTRVAEVEGVVPAGGRLERLRALVVIDPRVKATKLISFLKETGVAIAVMHEGKLRPLALDLDDRGQHDNPTWIEVAVTPGGLVVEAVPDEQIAVSDPAQLADAIAKARSARGWRDEAPVDVLVGDEVDVQRLIDVVVTLHVAGIKTIGLGATPPPAELARRGHRIPSIWFGQPSSQGDLDKAQIRKVVKQARPRYLACYEKALAANPETAGVIQTQFFITPNGTVAAANASGFDPELASCVAEVIKTLEFPKPSGGGGVQVNYPFAMRP